MLKLWGEIFAKKRKEFIDKRLALPFRQNLFFIFFFLAGCVLVFLVLNALFPGLWY